MKMSSEPFDLKSSCDKKYFGFLIKSRECGFNIKEYWSLVFCWMHSVLSRTSNLNNLRSDYPVCEWSESLSCPYLPLRLFFLNLCSNQPPTFLPDAQRRGNSTLSASGPPSDYPCFLSLFFPLFLPFYQLLYIFIKLCIKVVHAHHLIIK